MTKYDYKILAGRQQYHPSAVKAWVIFNGIGTVAIAASYNVSSITDDGTGSSTVHSSSCFSKDTNATGIGRWISLKGIRALRKRRLY